MYPANLSVPSKPAKLPFGVAARVSLDEPFHFVVVNLAIEVLKCFLVSDGLKCIQILVIAESQKVETSSTRPRFNIFSTRRLILS